MARQQWIYRTVACAGANAGRMHRVQGADPTKLYRALNAYYSNHDDCLFPSAIRFPYEASTASNETDPNIKGLDALAAAGLLKSLEDRDIHVKRYSAHHVWQPRSAPLLLWSPGGHQHRRFHSPCHGQRAGHRPR